MKNFVLPPPAPASIPVYNRDEQFPVRRIYCVGKNYADHVREMGGDPSTSSPVFFTKSREALVPAGAILPFPPMTENLHHEVELVVAMKSASKVYGYAAGLDMTRRDLQAAAKAKGGPWDMAKNFDQSAPCGALVPAGQFNSGGAKISLSVNGAAKQNSTLDHMIWSVDAIIKHLNEYVGVQAGDLIYTGTPDGVGPVKAGDSLCASIDGLPDLHISYALA